VPAVHPFDRTLREHQDGVTRSASIDGHSAWHLGEAIARPKRVAGDEGVAGVHNDVAGRVARRVDDLDVTEDESVT
jgi:hypothetical protein